MEILREKKKKKRKKKMVEFKTRQNHIPKNIFTSFNAETLRQIEDLFELKQVMRLKSASR